MTSNPAQREVGTAGWRMEQARMALGFPSVKSFAEHLGIRVSTLGVYRRNMESAGQRQRANALDHFRRKLPEGFAEYIEGGGSSAPPEAKAGWEAEVVRRQRETKEYSEAFEEFAAAPDIPPARGSFQESYQFYRRDGIPRAAAIVAALADLESRGQMEIADKYRPIFVAMLSKDTRGLAAAMEQLAMYGVEERLYEREKKVSGMLESGG